MDRRFAPRYIRRAQQHFAFGVSWSGLRPRSGPLSMVQRAHPPLYRLVRRFSEKKTVRQASETLPPEEDVMHRISFYFLILTVVGRPFSQESSDHQAPPPGGLGRPDPSG